jgi:hypothetical protein
MLWQIFICFKNHQIASFQLLLHIVLAFFPNKTITVVLPGNKPFQAKN